MIAAILGSYFSVYMTDIMMIPAASAMFALNFIRFGAPAVIGILIIVCLKFNPCEKHKDEIAAMKAKMK